MKVKESDIRENIAAHLHLLDPNLKIVAQEHYIHMPDGKTAYVDILAKDDFGCFTVIELKKSDQTARTAIQQLLKYASFLKNKNRLEESQVRCVVISTVWKELKEAFDEITHVSQYDFKGYSVAYEVNSPPVFQEIHPEYYKGDLSPLKNFIFFEFSKKEERDRFYEAFLSLLKKIPSCNSVLIKTDYEGNDASIIHPFGFSWVMFSSDAPRLEIQLAELERNPITDEQFDDGGLSFIGELEGEDYELRSKILSEHVKIDRESGEYVCLALHSLNNTLSIWKYEEPVGVGEMFSDGLFDVDDLLNMSSGFVGNHPYTFMVKTTPSRQFQFNMVRKKLNDFLESNSRWQNQVNYILNTLSMNDIAEIYIYNPLNFFGFLYDLGREGSSSRIPSLVIHIKRENGSEDTYQGLLAWTSEIAYISAEEAVKNAYPSLRHLSIRLVFQHMNDYDEGLSQQYGLTYEVISLVNDQLYLVQTSEDGCFLEKLSSIKNLNDFVKENDHLIDEVVDLFKENSVSILM